MQCCTVPFLGKFSTMNHLKMASDSLSYVHSVPGLPSIGVLEHNRMSWRTMIFGADGMCYKLIKVFVIRLHYFIVLQIKNKIGHTNTQWSSKIKWFYPITSTFMHGNYNNRLHIEVFSYSSCKMVHKSDIKTTISGHPPENLSTVHYGFDFEATILLWCNCGTPLFAAKTFQLIQSLIPGFICLD